MSLYYRHIRRDDSLSLIANVINLLILGEFSISNASYLGAYWSQPLGDKIFIYIDRVLGFDAVSYAKLLDAYPHLCRAFGYIYNSCELQFAILLPILLINHLAHGQRVLTGLYLAGFLSAVISALLPSLGPYIFYNIDIHQLRNMPIYSRIHEPLLVGLLMHTTNILPFPGLGIINFPSFHSVMAVMLVYACLPNSVMRIFFIPLNVLMLFAIPFIGGHYLIDVLAGILVALASIYLAERILPRHGKQLQLKRNLKPQEAPFPPLAES